MSYSRQYHQRIAVPYSVTVNYPASQNGGSTSKSGTVYEDVYVNIEVDTDPFDASVAGCNRSVNLLTGAVAATEAAQIVSIKSNANRVAGTIIEGFFKTIRSEISQQVVELAQRIDAHLLHLRELAKSCRSKQKQMDTDYNRLSSRYLKIFDDLNQELSNRIYELDKPAFVFKKECDKHAIRTSGNDMVSTIAVFGSEGGNLQAKISASVAKKRALDTINKANGFLWEQKKLVNTINQSMINENANSKKYAPVCFAETQGEKDLIGFNVYQPDFLQHINSSEIAEKFKRQNWTCPTKRNDNILHYFNAMVSKSYSSTNQHDERVKEMILKIFDLDSIKCS